MPTPLTVSETLTYSNQLIMRERHILEVSVYSQYTIICMKTVQPDTGRSG